jgi:hypothetical protein
MKKITLLLLLAFFAADFSYGQFALGVKLGYNANKLSTDIDTIKSQFNSGFHVGVWSRFGKRFYVAPELQYTMSGAIFSSESNIPNTSDWKQKITIGTMDIPVVVGFKIIHSDFLTWRIELGPQASFTVNKKIKEQTSVTGPITESSVSDMSWYVLGGTGIDFLFMKFDVRYQYGLNALIKDVGAQQLDAKNQMWVISLGFKIFGSK